MSFLSLGKSDADALVLEDVEQCMMAQLDPANVEISVVGDFDAAECERFAVAYVGCCAAAYGRRASDGPRSLVDEC